MMGKITADDIKNELSKTIHPEINYSLLKLGMIKDISVERGRVSLTLVLPFLEIPIKEDLIIIIKESVKNLDKSIETEVEITEMDKKEIERFMKIAKEGWNV